MRPATTPRRVAALVVAACLLAVPGAATADTADQPDPDQLQAFTGAPEPLVGEPEPLFSSIASLYGDLDGLIVAETPDGTEVTTAADILFAFDSSDLEPEAEDVLGEATELLVTAGPDQVLVRGHTDGIGTDAYNDGLSTDRAEAVVAFLEATGELDGITFEVEGVGSREPVAEEEDEDGEDLPEGRAQNRRVELVFRAP